MRHLTVSFFARIALAIYLAAAGLALLGGDWVNGADAVEPIWFPFVTIRSVALPFGVGFVIAAALLVSGKGARAGAVIATALIVICLVAQLERSALYDTATHIAPLLALGLVVLGGFRAEGQGAADSVVLILRCYLGAIFTAQGIHSILVVGLARFAERVYVEPFAHSILPRALLWVAGMTNPVIQLVAGVLLLVGFQTAAAATAAALFLLTIFFGHVVEDPFDRGPDVHDFAMINFAAALLILAFHRGRDAFSLDAFLRRRGRAVAATAAALTCLLVVGCSTVGKPQPINEGRPALVVMIVVDQLRADLLDRYDRVFTGGFRRLRDEGFVFRNAYVNHAPTTSFPGHTTLATGCNPAKHGIVAGGWPEYAGNGKFNAIDPARDDTETIVGFPALHGASPRRILVPALPDWLMAADPDSRVVAVGGGEFSSLLHAGHTRQATYWFDSEAGQFVTSSYYSKSYPQWVARFNADELPQMRDIDAWTCSVPEQDRALALPDAEPFEFDGEHTHFPHRFADESSVQGAPSTQARAEWFTWTPQRDEATFALASRAVESLSLGTRGHSDYISVVASQVDSIGHRYGPLSLETLDTLVRLDRDLDAFFRLLDSRVGRGRWVVALTADHGVDDIPEHLRETGVRARRLTQAELDSAMDAAFAIAQTPATPREAEAVRAALLRFDFIARVMTPTELTMAPNGDVIGDLYRRSYRSDRVPVTIAGSRGSLARLGLVAVLTPHTITEAPANHGSPYDYDRHVPLILYGAGVPRGAGDRVVHTTDVAPTLAALGKIPIPAGIDGQPLLGSPSADALREAAALLSRPTAQTVRQAIAILERTDKTAGIHALLASANLASERYGDVPHSVALAAARGEVEAALRLDPENTDSLAVAAEIALTEDLDRERAAQLYERILVTTPTNAGIRFEWALLLASRGDRDPAMIEWARALADAGSEERQEIVRGSGRLLYETRQYAQVTEWAAKLDVADRRVRGIAAFYRGLASGARGLFEDALRDHLQAVDALGRDAGALAALARSYAQAGRRDDALTCLRELETRYAAGKWVVRYQIATAYEALGDREKTFTWLERAVDDRDGWLMWLNVDPRWDAIRTDTRFVAILRRAGFRNPRTS